jgi:hypothetical protein
MKTLLANLIYDLFKRGFIRSATEVSEILSELMEDEDNNAEDVSSVANIVGLRGDVKPEEPIGGMTFDPAFSDVGDPF